jgi:hypothetical protein
MMMGIVKESLFLFVIDLLYVEIVVIVAFGVGSSLVKTS